MKSNQLPTSPAKWLAPALLAAVIGTSLTASAFTFTGGGVVSPVQSSADPLGLPIVGPVLAANSDATSKQFNQSVLPGALNFVSANLPEGQNNSGNSALLSIDPSKITLATSESLQAYFVSEGAGYDNTLGFNTGGTGLSGGDPKIIFPDVSSQEDFNPNPANTYGARTPSEPLLPGDFVNLGNFKAGTSLDFFLIANGANGGTPVYNSGGAAANPDGFDHVTAFTTSPNSPYLFLAFEDLPNGGDQDYNDVVIAINVGAKTIHSLLATPEPSMYLTLGGFLALAIWAKRRMDQNELATEL
jgi:hypothetical protein